jgi:hypothetical protein
VRQDDVVDLLLRKLQAAYLNPAHLRALRKEVACQESQARSPDRTAARAAAIEDLEAKVRRGRENLSSVPTDMVGDCVAQICVWEH